MENFVKRKRPSISLSIFATLSESFSSDKWLNSIKSPKRFEGGVVGLGIVAAMTDLNRTHEAFSSTKFSAANSLVPSPPIPIVLSAKPAANFKGGLNLERNVVDELSESYTCVISHCGNNRIRKRVYFDDKLNGVVDDCPACMVGDGVFSASPLDIGGEAGREFRTADFLDSCYLCKKQLHGLDIFMYRGEKAFCSAECREKQMGNDDQKEKCKSEASKQLDCSVTPCSTSPMVFFAGVAAA